MRDTSKFWVFLCWCELAACPIPEQIQGFFCFFLF